MNPVCRIYALSAHAPHKILTNEYMAGIADTNNEWIVSRTGIRERRKLEKTQNTSDLALIAARETLQKTGMEADALTHVITATCTPDMLSPSVACILAGHLNAGQVMAFDISAACSGFLYGLSLCRSILAHEVDARILFVCAEALTRRVNWNDRSTCVLFGDAASACVLTGESADAHDSSVLEDVICKSDGALSDLITVGGGTACNYRLGDQVDERFFLAMLGRDTYRHAVRQMALVCEEILQRNALTVENVNLFVPHQANLRIIEAVGSRLHINGDRVFTNVDKYGNTSAASIPLALSEAFAAGRVRQGDRVLLAAFGAGLTWSAALLRY
ncbi:MAG: 3-oxoacyl-[acyl-carrier-protein] synthase 3 [Candidatus Desulfovibrio kirbyi]|jgi:3-oxoacyl-[acyl-carrier-protein] synthase-3|uniref:Beta-ketoacyl-[acyl-carrier-protein] synthase III n=1 Tax=Candidatus Desulfovibrio kirbyi TaxID=2696086 RepID=A0A6L2R533_9BACT|nr:ketoacyl-ACP synthase III [Desulfovibrio sp.]GFH62613.1 MAG: 3-oxoacyl-[acyl-carrier-protein] synthase 3 [Candidatus Desulfovibrio kirbyi]